MNATPDDELPDHETGDRLHEEDSFVDTAVETPPVSSGPIQTASDMPPLTGKKNWYVVKVTAAREETIRDAIERRIKIEGLEAYYGQIYIPVERVTERRNNKNIVKERKLYPGYFMAELEFNDRMLVLFREINGVGDFVGGSITRPPTPMSELEVQRMLRTKGEVVATTVAIKPEFQRGDRVKIKDGTFSGMEGEVKEIIEALHHVKVELTIIGRTVPVELEYWQVEAI